MSDFDYDLEGKPIIRGSPVFYKGKKYYYQPIGNSCYLYDNKEDVGKIHLKKYSPRTHIVKNQTKIERENINNNNLSLNSSIYVPNNISKEEINDTDTEIDRIDEEIEMLSIRLLELTMRKKGD